MPQSLANVLIHTIFSTKDRAPFLKDAGFRRETHAYMAGVTDKLGCKAIRIGGVEDHVHLLTTLSRTVTIADFVKETKRATTDWIQNQGAALADFHWQRGYGVFSVSESARDEVVRYILNQEDHHRYLDFKDEFRRFCKKHGVEVDECYAWD
jgi:putative transposase